MKGDLSELSSEELVQRFQSAVATVAPVSRGLAVDPMAPSVVVEVRALKAEILRRLSTPRLFDKPQGPATLGPFSDGSWCIGEGRGTEKAVVCQGCGTLHPETPGEAKSVSEIGDITIVDACCGAWPDELFRALGQIFCGRYLDLLLKNNRVITSGPISHLPDIIICTPVEEIIPR